MTGEPRLRRAILHSIHTAEGPAPYGRWLMQPDVPIRINRRWWRHLTRPHPAHARSRASIRFVAGTSVFGAPDYAAAIARPSAIARSMTLRWVRDARRAMAKLPSLRMGRVPDGPTLPVRDLWPGDPGPRRPPAEGRVGVWRRGILPSATRPMGRPGQLPHDADSRARLHLAARPTRPRHRRGPRPGSGTDRETGSACPQAR